VRVIGYVRVSSSEQATEGVSLASQRAKVGGYARLHDLELVEVIEDAGASAKSLDRPGLARALAMLTRGEADALVVTKLDRLSRSVSDWDRLITDHFGPDAGHALMSVGDSIDTRTAAGRLVLNVLMSVAQWEREAIVERTRDAMRHKRSKGERLGTIPYGSALGPDGRTLLPVPSEVEALALMRQLADAGTTLRGIAAELDARGYPTKGNAARWSHVTVMKILARPVTD
jgi:site-specific DNA recombinase